MMAKKKCPVCGAKNDKERMVCIECGTPLALEQVGEQLARVSTEGETRARAGRERAEARPRDDEKALHKAMGPRVHKKNAWFWVGVVLLSISALWWLIIILVPGDIGDAILVGVVTTIVPIGIAVYCVRRGRKAPPAEIRQKPKPTYMSRQTVMMTQETEAAPEPANRPEPTAKPKSSIDRYAVQDTKKILYRTRCKLSLPHKKPEEADCLVTGNHVAIETGEPIAIALSRIRECRTERALPSVSYPAPPSQPLSGTMTLTFLDDLSKKRKLALEMAEKELHSFKQAIYGQIVGRFIREAQGRRPNTTLGKFFFKIKEVFRDKTRDRICAGLRMLEIDARMAARGQVEEKVVGKGSLGIIHVPDGPIRWINVRKETHSSGQYGSTTYYYTEYGVPDSILGPDSPGAQIETVRVKSFPLFGKVVDLRWKGWDSDLGIIGRLNSDAQLKQQIMESRDMTITAIGGYSCWIMSTQTRDVPSGELWNCYQVIAQHLLADWSSG